MSYELFIANRYLKSKRKTGFISLITYISIIGVMIGVAALIIVLSIMNGFEGEVRSRIIGFGSHIELRTYHNEGIEDFNTLQKKVEPINHIIGISPYINEMGLIVSKNKKRKAVAVKGVDSATVSRVSDVKDNINYGIFELGQVEADNGRKYPGIVLGTYLADKIGVDIGDRVQILSPSGISPMMSSIPPIITFYVTGFFETGIYEFDDVFAYVDIKEAQKLFKLKNKVTGLEIKLDDLDNADIVANDIKNMLGYPYAAITWFDMNKNLFAWMQFEKWGMFIILSLIIMVAAFNIISTLIMIVLEKTKDIGILKAMGATKKSIMKIFIYEGLVGGVIGTVLGCIIGFTVCWLQLKYEFIALPADVYIISALPVQMKGLDFLMIAGSAIMICYLATVYPARKASQLNPVEAIRYE